MYVCREKKSINRIQSVFVVSGIQWGSWNIYPVDKEELHVPAQPSYWFLFKKLNFPPGIL